MSNTEITTREDIKKASEKATHKFDFMKTSETEGFELELNWAKQKDMIRKIMISDEFNEIDGITEVRSALKHSLPIKLSSAMKGSMKSLSGLKKGSAKECYMELDDSNPNWKSDIRQASLDWKYDAIERKSGEMTPEMLIGKVVANAQSGALSMEAVEKLQAKLAAMLEMMK